MSIREATTDDAPEIRQLVLSLSHFYLKEKDAALPIWFSKSLSLDEFKSRIGSDDFLSFVFEKNNEITGYISLKNESHIFHLFVTEAFQKQGIARNLWEHAKFLTTKEKYTVRSSEFAIPVYQHFGFKEVGIRTVKDGLTFQVMEYINS